MLRSPLRSREERSKRDSVSCEAQHNYRACTRYGKRRRGAGPDPPPPRAPLDVDLPRCRLRTPVPRWDRDSGNLLTREMKRQATPRVQLQVRAASLVPRGFELPSLVSMISAEGAFACTLKSV